MSLECEFRGNGWRLEKRLDLGTLLSVASALVVVAALVAGLRVRQDAQEERLCAVSRRLDESQAVALKVERLDERLGNMQAVLAEIRDELKRREAR